MGDLRLVFRDQSSPISHALSWMTPLMSTRKKLWMVRFAWLLLATLAWVNREPLTQWVEHASDASIAIRLVGYFATYVTLAGLAVPGAVLLSALAGSLFGVLWGTVIASFTSTCGATIAFLMSRRLLFGRNHSASGDDRLHRSVQMRGWDLLLLRLTPAMPFFAVNVLAGKSRMTTRQFWFITQLGTLPANYFLVQVGYLLTNENTVAHLGIKQSFWQLSIICLIAWTIRLATVCARYLNHNPIRVTRKNQLETTQNGELNTGSLNRGVLIPTLFMMIACSGCASPTTALSLDSIYSPLAKLPDYERNPVIVIPGVLGSKLVDDETGETVWGKYDRIRLIRQQAENLAAVSLPMAQGVPLSELRDQVRSDGTLAYLELKVFGVPVELQAYSQILKTLGVGGYRDSSRPRSDGVDYGDDHFTCFQFDYDWRRDISENSALLAKFIEEKRVYIRNEYERRYGIVDAEIKFDIVSHSLGGLVSRYYLRYGAQPLPDDGSMPELNWDGAKNVHRLVMVGTPNAGSAFAIRDLVNGHQLSRFLPYYPPAALGTMPSLYQMLPRPRHQTLVDAKHPDQFYDFYNPELWQQMKWGLASPDQADVLKELLPDVAEPEARACIALDHQRKCLLRASQFHQSIDIPAGPPPGVTLHLYAGDAIETPSVMSVDTKTGVVNVAMNSPGDDTTTRQSAVMSEQPVQLITNRPTSPIPWTSVMFLHTSHRKLTSDPIFTDNILALLLTSPER